MGRMPKKNPSKTLDKSEYRAIMEIGGREGSLTAEIVAPPFDSASESHEHRFQLLQSVPQPKRSRTMIDFPRGYTIHDEMRMIASANQPATARRVALAAAKRTNSPMCVFQPGTGPRVALVYPDGHAEIPDIDKLVKRWPQPHHASAQWHPRPIRCSGIGR